MFGLLKKRMNESHAKTEDFFYAAVSAFAQKADDNAYHAALLTGVVVDPSTLTNFIRYLGWVAGSVERPELSIRLLQLVGVLLAKNWTPADEPPCRDKLKAKDYEYWSAYCNRDATIFQRRHKDLAVPRIGDVLSADAQLHSVFNDPEVVMALWDSKRELFKKLVRLGIIDVLSVDAKLHRILNHPEMVTALSESEPVLFQKLVRLGIIILEPGATP